MASLENFRLVVFRAVAEQLSFRKAAEQLYLTQPAVSLQIKALEEDLGAQLFDRSGAQVSLTPAGEVLLHYAHQSHTLLLEADAEIGAVTGHRAGELAIGASTTIAQYVLPRLLGEFRGLHPRISLRLVSGNTENIVDAIAKHRIAIGFIEGPARSRDVKTQPFLVDELVLIAPAAHQWARRDRIPCSLLTSAPLLMRERGSGTRDVIEAALERHGIKRASLQIAMELDSTEAIKSAVEAGLGAGFVSSWALAQDARLGIGFKVVNLDHLRIRRDLLIARPAGPEPHGSARELRRFLLARSAVRAHLPRARPQAPSSADKIRK